MFAFFHLVSASKMIKNILNPNMDSFILCMKITNIRSIEIFKVNKKK